MEAIFLRVLNMSLAASGAILLVLLARLALRRLPKLYSYALWSVVLFRLLCPFSFASVFSLLPVNAEPIPRDIGMMPTPRIDLGVAPIDRSVNAILPPPAAPAASVNPMQVWIAVGSFLWVAGMLLLLAGSVASLLRLRRRLCPAVCESGNVWLAPGLDTPFVMGLLCPRIYLPENLAGEEKRYILLHEETHIRRGDHLVRLLAFLALCLHWFNPLVWLSFSLAARDMEMSCDEQVIGQLGDGVRRDYSGSLLSLATGRRIFGGTPLAFGEGDTGARIKNVLRYRKPALWAALAAVAVVAALCFGLAANPKREQPSGVGKAIENFVLAESPITLHDGTRASLLLVITEGRIIDGEEAGLGGGIVPDENYTGHGELRLAVNGAVRSSLPLTEEEQTAGGMHFTHRNFPIRFGDYNGDGNPDFSIGQWGSSSVNLFSLFTIDPVGQIKRISDPLWITSSEGKGQEDYSVSFFAENGVIRTQYYNNAVGEAQPICFVWDDAREKFDEQADPLAAERQWIADLLSSCRVVDGVAELTCPPAIPASYALSLHVSGLMPVGDGSSLSLHAFEETEANRSWEAGRAYRERLFDENPPDGTELSFYAGFTDGTGTVILWDSLTFVIRNGEPKAAVSPLDTTAAVQTGEAGRTEITYTDAAGGQFTASLTLPRGWTAAPAQPGEPAYTAMLFVPVNLYANDRLVGTIATNDFAYRPEARGENFRVSVYHDIMLGSVVSWDDSYTPVRTTDNAETATCRVRCQTGGAGGTTEYNDGILSYDIGLLKYIAIELEEDAVDAGQLAQIAGSVSLSR